MGRKSKGDRHKIIPSMPPAAAAFIKADAVVLGCHIGDYIGWMVSRQVDVPMELPLGELTEHPDPVPAADGRVKYRAMLPREAADLVIADAELRGVTLGDYVTKVVCDHYDVPFEPRVKKKALKAWQTAVKAGAQLPMTG
jgi:hypothetical protein